VKQVSCPCHSACINIVSVHDVFDCRLAGYLWMMNLLEQLEISDEEETFDV
jgi:hypothetical protein